MKRKFALSLILATGLFATMFTSCKKDDDDDDKKAQEEVLTASFTYEGDHRPTPGDVVFTNTSKLATSYHWDFGDNTTSEEQNPTHSYAAAGKYEVTLTVTDADGNSKEKKSTLTMLGNCTKFGIEALFVHREAVTEGDGTEWDVDGTGPDMYFKIFDANNTELFNLGSFWIDVPFDDSVNTAVIFSDTDFETMPVEINSISETYKIIVYDYDAENNNASEEMCIGTFKMEDFLPTNTTDPYPAMFEISTPHISANISWLD